MSEMKKPDNGTENAPKKKWFQHKKLRYGGMTALVVVVVIAATILLNYGVTTLQDVFSLKLDVTGNRLYSLTQQSVDLLDGLEEDVEIYTLFRNTNLGSGYGGMLQKFLDNYQGEHVTVENVDPVVNPTFTKDFDKSGNGIAENSVIVTNKDHTRFRVFAFSDMFTIAYNASYQAYPEGLQAENKVTGAIQYVTSEDMPTAHFLTGHQETDLTSMTTLEQYLEDASYTVAALDLTQGALDIGENDVIVVVSPQKDLTADELAELKEYLAQGGRMLMAMDVSETNLPNFAALLEDYQAKFDTNVIIEQKNGYYHYQSPLILIPDMGEQEIVSTIASSNLSAVLPAARSLTLPTAEVEGLTVETLLTTSSEAFATENFQTDGTKQQGDIQGPFTVAAAITKQSEAGDSQLVLVGNGNFMMDGNIEQYGNVNLAMNSIQWLAGSEQTALSIEAKSFYSEAMNFTSRTEVYLLMALVVLVIPLIVFAVGVVVRIRRRKL
ncbi:GldG family protein [Gehongia tenuis]|uniref:GldG family protein n=1 Tax=Gehongia tenuis TaxID=2763655 RepID=A0A926HN63_9FIRM|nr:GldG family protein [Gehongia tenuis]MBC8530254.1 GldG family protein [Gehongia tenuis]